MNGSEQIVGDICTLTVHRLKRQGDRLVAACCPNPHRARAWGFRHENKGYEAITCQKCLASLPQTSPINGQSATPKS